MGIKLENLKAGYEKKIIIDSISLEIQPGSVVTLIGPNGCGKSTILKNITGQLKKLGGTVYLDGKDMTGLKDIDIARSVSMVMTERIHPELMSCREIVETGRYPHTGRMGLLSQEDRRLVDEAIKLMHAEDVADSQFNRISDGQRQRIMLARAICQDTKVMILDEPTSYLDMKYKLDILESIKRLSRERGIAVFMSLHELDLAKQISDVVVAVENGKAGRIGRPEDVFTDGYIQRLYSVPLDSFNEDTGMLFTLRNTDKPRVFVIGGGGQSIPVYQKLARDGIPFAAGILYENDIEMPFVKGLASEYVSIKAFDMMTEDDYRRALEMMKSCSSCICASTEFGSLNAYNKKLYEYAVNSGTIEAV